MECRLQKQYTHTQNTYEIPERDRKCKALIQIPVHPWWVHSPIDE